MGGIATCAVGVLVGCIVGCSVGCLVGSEVGACMQTMFASFPIPAVAATTVVLVPEVPQEVEAYANDDNMRFAEPMRKCTVKELMPVSANALMPTDFTDKGITGNDVMPKH